MNRCKLLILLSAFNDIHIKNYQGFVLTRSFTILFYFIFLFVSCKQNPPDKELWGVVINFISPDTTYYPAIKKFPFPDSLRFAPLEVFFTNETKTPIIGDSTIVFFDNYRANGQKLCCKKDTLQLFIDSLKGKKYLFAIGEYISVFQSNNTLDTNLRTRRNFEPIFLWGIQLNTPYPPEKFTNDYEKLGAKFVKIDPRIDEVSKQKWNDNDSILVETIQFNNSTDRIITAVYKEMNKNQVDSTISYLISRFPNLKYKEATQPDSDGNQLKIIRINFQGVAISFEQVTRTEYSFMITDYYETLKLIINNAETGYFFRDDLRIY